MRPLVFRTFMVLATNSSLPERGPGMRIRLAVSLAALALLVLLVHSLAMVLVIDRKEDEFIDHQLDAQIAHSMEVWHRSPADARPNSPAMWLYRVGRDGVADVVPPLLAGLAVGNHEVYLGSKEYHVAVREDDSARYVLAYDVEGHESRLDSLLLITVSAALFLGLLTLFAGYLLAGRLTRRLERLAIRVEQEAPGPLAEPGMERELRAVADALDHYRERQGAMLEGERAFAANLSHELRTPLTGIRTDAELLAALPDLPEIVARRSNRIVGSVDRINGLANSLLILAREAKPTLIEEIRLRPAIESVWDSLMLAAPKAVGLRLEIPEGSTVTADPSLFDLVLRNLLDNALRYSETGEIVCRLADRMLIVRDTGPGFAECDLPRVFDRFFVGPRGANGLGLALVRHVCSANGWRVSASNAAAGGGEITIDFGTGLAGD